jgi:hypothetical protein
MVETKRPDRSPEEAHRSDERTTGDLAEGKTEDGGEKQHPCAALKMSIEEHLAGLWRVLGLGD